MRRGRGMIVALAALAAGVALGHSAARTAILVLRPSDAGPQAVLLQRHRAFGAVPAGEVLRAHFPLRNAGSRRLVVRRETSACDCLVTPDSEVILGPGQSTELEIQWRPEPVPGPVQERARYQTSDPRLPQFELRLSAEIQ